MLRVNWVGVDRNSAAISHQQDRPMKKDDGREAWRVSVMHDGYWVAVGNYFASEQDAKRAMLALQRANLETAEGLQQAGAREVFRIMAEALCW